MGVPSCCLCSSHDSGVSTPSVFSQSKNALGRSLDQLEISFPRPNVKAIFSPFPLSHQFTHRSVHHLHPQGFALASRVLLWSPAKLTTNSCFVESAVVARRDLTATLEVLWIGFFKRTTHFHTFFCGLV